MIKNCIFDFGNVLAEFNPDKLTAPYFKDEAVRREIKEVVFDRAYWDRLDSGTITDEEVKAGIRSRVAPEYADGACAAYDEWIENLTPVAEMTELAEYIKSKGIKLYLLSNISTGFAKRYSCVPWIRELFELFDGLVFSAEIQLTKPNTEIFQYVLNKYGLKAEECIFVDDSEKNICGAQSAGIKGWLFNGAAAELRKFFELQ